MKKMEEKETKKKWEYCIVRWSKYVNWQDPTIISFLSMQGILLSRVQALSMHLLSNFFFTLNLQKKQKKKTEQTKKPPNKN